MAKTALLLMMAAAAVSPPKSTAKIPTPPLQFVEMYVTELSTFEELRKDAARELEEDKPDFARACIYSGTKYDLEVGAAARTFDQMQLSNVSEQLRNVPQMFADLYRQRQRTMQNMTAICSAFAKGEQPGVDYTGLAANMPKIRAQLDFIDRTAFEASPLVFATLISDVPDTQGHASHLIITCEERKRLIEHIEGFFGAALNEKNPP